MTRFRPSFSILLIFLCVFIFFFNTNAKADPECPPILTLPDNLELNICTGDSACFDVLGSDAEADDTLTLSLVEGPLDFDSAVFYDDFTRTFCFTPETSGAYRFIFQLHDKWGYTVIDTVIYTVVINTPPVIADQDFSEQLCYGATNRSFVAQAEDADQDQLSYVLLSGPGYINESTGLISYEATESGLTTFEVAVYDECGGDTAVITDNVIINQPPSIVTEDIKVFLCEPEEYCFDVIASDPEGGTVEIVEQDQLGTFTQVSDSSGSTCFMPADVDSADYYFYYCLRDECPIDPEKAVPPCILDSVKVTVILDRPPTIICPDEVQEFFTCDEQTFCFPVSIIDQDFNDFTVNILSENATYENGNVCFVGQESDEFDIVIEAVDECGLADTCTVPVQVHGNREPVISVQDDFDVSLCNQGEVCFDVMASDPDFNIEKFEASPIGTYDGSTDRVCFTPDTAGTYIIYVTVADSCGATDMDSIVIGVTLNELPQVSFVGNDTSIVLCEPEELCFDINLSDDNIRNLYVSYGGHYDEQTGQVCFSPEVDGEYRLIVRIDDYCDKVAADTLFVTVESKVNKPEVNVPDSNVFLCEPDMICIPVEISDLDDDIVSIQTNRGQYNSETGEVCFVPYDKGPLDLIVTVTDECGHVVADTGAITIETEDVVLDCPGDTTVFLCEPSDLEFFIGGIPENGEVSVSGTNVVYNPDTHTVSFFSDCCLENTITVTVVTPCRTYSCSFTVTIITNSKPMVMMKKDTTLNLCEPAEICLPVGVTDVDENVDSIVVRGEDFTYNPYYETVCFTPMHSGTYEVVVVAYDECTSDSATSLVTVNLNQAPAIEYTLENPDFRQCTFEEICIPTTIIDPDENLASINIDNGAYYDLETKSVCYMPTEAGEVCLTVIAADSCELADTAVICFNVITGESVTVTCPEIQEPYDACIGDTICVPVDIQGDYTSLMIDPAEVAYYNEATGEICIVADTAGTYGITVTAEAECNTSSCTFSVPVNIPDPVEIVCPEQPIYRFECNLPRSLLIPFEINGDVVDYEYSPAGLLNYDPLTGQLQIQIDSAGTYELTVIANGLCNSDTCDFTFVLSSNEAPVVEAHDSTVVLCDLEQVCIPVSISDKEDDLDLLIIDVQPSGIYGDGKVCFTPDAFGDYEFTVTVTDLCGVPTTANYTVSVIKGDTVAIGCPGTIEPIALCGGPQEICLNVPVEGQNYQLLTFPEEITRYENGQLCFTADTSGLYELKIAGYAGCNADSCMLQVDVTISDSVEIACPGEVYDVFECEEQQSVDIPVDISGEYLTLDILPEGATYNEGTLTIPVSGSGEYPVRLIADGPCNADTCGFTVNLGINTPPELTVIDDTVLTVCELPEEICVPFTVFDADDNIEQIGSLNGQLVDHIVCIYPTRFGDTTISLFVTDTCGERTEKNINVSINQGEAAEITCPQTALGSYTEVFPYTVSWYLEITPADVEVSVSDGNYNTETQELSLEVNEPGSYTVTVIASALCGADTCEVTFVVNEYAPPVVVCKDTTATLCLLEPKTVCIPVEIYGTDYGVATSMGTYENGNVCFEVTEPGDYEIQVIASNIDLTNLPPVERADTCTFTATIDGGIGPVVTLPEDVNVALCNPTEYCIPVDIQLGDFDLVSVTSNYGTYNSETRELCFMLDTAGVYELIVTATDDCNNEHADTTYMTLKVNTAPVVDLGDDFNKLVCEEEVVCTDFTVTDIDDNISEIFAHEPAYINGENQVCFTASQAGSYDIIVEAVDACGASSADTVTVTVEGNTAPTITPMNDTSVYICRPDYICLPVEFSDIDNNIASVTVNRGTYNDGEICFVPYDTGNFQVILTVTDSCGLEAKDTAMVRVDTELGVVINCPNDTSIFLCEPTNLCFPITGIPEGAQVNVGGSNVTWNDETDEVCFFSDCCFENTISIEVITECNTYTCSFTVQVQTNSDPIVILPKDTTVLQCELTEICLPVGINDIDNNLTGEVDVSGPEGITYHSYYGTVCYTPTGSSVDTIIVKTTDECEAEDADTMVVTVVENQAPVVIFNMAPPEFKLCQLEEICFQEFIYDPDGNMADITISPVGTFDVETGNICFTPDTFGVYTIYGHATDECGLTDEDSIKIYVSPGDTVALSCPEPVETTLCEPQVVCVAVPIEGQPLEIIGGPSPIRTYPEGTYYEDGNFCFMADTSGTYTLSIAVQAQCNTDSCDFTVNVDILDPLTITCPGDVDSFLCQPDTLIFNFEISSSVDEVTLVDTASTPAFIEGTQIHVPVLEEGTRTITMTASGFCGETQCSFDVTAELNQAPVVVMGNDTTLTECDLHEVCVLVSSVSDANGNIDSITYSLGYPTIDNYKGEFYVCFNPADYDGFGSYDVIVAAYDDCGEIGADTVHVDYLQGDSAKILECPEEPFFSMCEVGEICLYVPITPDDAEVTVLPYGRYDTETNMVCFMADTGGTYNFKVIADAQCSADTCDFTVQVEMFEHPQVECPAQIDTMLCLTEPKTLCFDVPVTGSGVEVDIKPDNLNAYYSAGVVCLPVSEAGTYELQIIGHNACSADTCATTVVVEADQAPELYLPERMTFERCPDDTNTICIPDIYAVDPEDSAVTITQVCGPDAFEAIRDDSGQICFVPDAIGEYEFCFEADDGCNVTSGSFIVDVVLKDNCDVCLTVSIDGGECSPVGLKKTVALNIESNDPIAGFDLLLNYDLSLTFLSATIANTDIDGWEYFTYNSHTGVPGNLRLIGIADNNNGPAHPPVETLSPNGILVYIDYLIANNQNLGDVFIPIKFVWYDCGDNTFSDPSGTILYTDLRIYDAESNIVWDEENDPEDQRLPYVGAPDECMVGTDKGEPLRCIEFYNGGVCIIHPDSIDDRGDLNLNGIPYEIGDAVLYTNYFIKGLAAFTINIDGQIAASDVNADGLTLTVADLIYLIRVLLGDASRYPKMNPYAEDMVVGTKFGDGKMTVSTETVSDIGGAWFVYEIDDNIVTGVPKILDQAAGMELKYSIEGNRLKILVYNIGYARIPSGSNDIMEIPVTGEGNIRLVSAEAADYDGRPYNTAAKTTNLPTGFNLSQNYPNPFNPTTTIEFALPTATDWTMTIYNIKGEVVKEYSGSNTAGVVELVWDGTSQKNSKIASGVYFYRLNAGDYTSETKKMILLK